MPTQPKKLKRKTEEKLKPCRKCRRLPVPVISSGWRVARIVAYYHCDGCQAYGEPVPYTGTMTASGKLKPSSQDAIAAWNRRAK